MYLCNLFHPSSLTAPSWVIYFTQDALHFVLSVAFGLLRTFRGTASRFSASSCWLAVYSADISVLRFCSFGPFWEVGEGSVECNGGSRRVYKIGIGVEIDARLNLRETEAETGWITVFSDMQFSCLHKDWLLFWSPKGALGGWPWRVSQASLSRQEGL